MSSLIFRTTAHIVTSLMLVFSLYLLLRGHNEPGGGFIAALIAAIAFSLLILAESAAYVRSRLVIPPITIAYAGLACALVSGLLSLTLGLPLFTGLWWKNWLPIGTPVLFDVGVFLSVLGSVLTILLHLKEQLD